MKSALGKKNSAGKGGSGMLKDKEYRLQFKIEQLD